MKIISYIQTGGGNGKSVSTLQTCAGLIKAGKRVLAVDMDDKATLTSFLRAHVKKGESELLDVLLAVGRDDDPKPVLEKAIKQTKYGDVLPTSDRLTNEGAIWGSDMLNTLLLQKALEPLQKQYDYCVIDTPGRQGLLPTMAMVASDIIIVVVKPEASGLADTYKMEKQIANAKIIREQIVKKDFKIDGILPTMYVPRSTHYKEHLEYLQAWADKHDTAVYPFYIRRSMDLSKSVDKGLSIFDYKKSCNTAQDYEVLISHILDVTK